MNNINHVLTKAYEEFLFRVAPYVDREMVQEKSPCHVADFFKSQAMTDTFKVALKKDWHQAMRLYFEGFLVKDTVDWKRLKYGITPVEKNVLRYLGKDRLAYLKLLISVAEETRDKRGGLLFGDAS